MDSVIQFEGTIYANGYGLLAQSVMRNKELPRQSKLIYAYMCSFAGINEKGERTAFPSVRLQCEELGMSEDTYFKWRKPLIEYGYIKISKQRNKESKFDRNIYSIVAVPKENRSTEEKPYPNSSGAEKRLSNQGSEPYPNSSGTEKSSTVNKGTNINSSNINNKELDTTDTDDTSLDFSQKFSEDELFMSEQERQAEKEKYMTNAFYNNKDYIPENIANMLKVFTRTPEQAEKYYNIILLAKKRTEEHFKEMIWLEEEEELTKKIIDSFSRSVRNIEKGKEKINNPDGYIYNSIFHLISKEINARHFKKQMKNNNSVYFNWLNNTEEN